MVEVLEVTVKFSLPDWFPPRRLDYDRVNRYSPGHMWAGQIESRDCENSAVDAICRLKDMHEICYDPMGPWITFNIKPSQIELVREKLVRFLSRYRESTKSTYKTYVNGVAYEV